MARQQQAGWGAKIVQQLAKNLRSAFPDMTGFSHSNLMTLWAFAEAYLEISFVQQVVGRLPWGHNVVLIERVKDPVARKQKELPEE